MISLITGEDIVASRNKLTELLHEAKNVMRIDGKKQGFVDVRDALSANSLFNASKTIVVDTFTKIKPQNDFFDLVLTYEKDSSTEIYLWEDSELTPKVKDKFKNAKSYVYSFPKYYYVFLDGFAPHSSSSLKLFHDVVKTFEPEQVLYGLLRRIRHLMVLKSGNYATFSEFKNMQSWQLGKLKKQADFWSEEELKNCFLKIAELDEKIKTSGLTMPLAQHLDIILMQDLN